MVCESGQSSATAYHPPVAVNLPACGSYTCEFSPPPMNTLPFGTRKGVLTTWLGEIISPVGVNVPAPGSYSSAEVRTAGQGEQLTGLRPPAIRTFPFPSRTAMWLLRATAMLPVGAKVPIAGSYNSALERAGFIELLPPAINTRPSARRVAVWYRRDVAMLPVKLND